MTEQYSIKTNAFEGPLDLLLNLIEKRKLFINDISLAEITDDYISYIQNHPDMSLRLSADFIWIASTLMLIKSRSLLPNLNLSQEEEQNIEDLEERLKIYKQIKKLSIGVQERFGKEMIFQKTFVKDSEPIFSPDKEITQKNMFTLAVGVLTKMPKKEITPKGVVQKVISLEEMMDSLADRMKKAIKMSFNDFSNKGKDEKINVVISFLAMLELVKQGALAVRQNHDFGDMEMESLDVGLPHY